MSVKVSELQQIDELLDSAYLMAVQNGKSVKFLASLLQKKDEAVANAKLLNGYSDTDFVKANAEGKNDADLLGGLDATQFATKEYVDNKTVASEDPTWCTPKLWFDATNVPNGDTTHWRFCDGSSLLINDYPDLFNVIGWNFTRSSSTGEKATSGDYFCLPDMRARFPMGAWATNPSGTSDKTRLVTTNLGGLYTKDNYGGGLSEWEFLNGEWAAPLEVGIWGGDPTTTQLHVQQIAQHQHEITPGENSKLAYWNTSIHEAEPSKDSGGRAASMMLQRTDVSGGDYNTFEGGTKIYPAWGSGGKVETLGQGMLSINPYISFAWVMRIKK